MTTPVPPPFDPAHPAVGSCQAWLTTGKHDGPNGQLLIVTVVRVVRWESVQLPGTRLLHPTKRCRPPF